VQTAKHKRQINGDVIVMVSPSAMPVDSMQKPMALIARSSFMTVSSRKGLKTEFKNKMNIRGQYFIKLSVQTEKLKKQIDGGVIVMVSPSAMLADSTQKPMALIVQSISLTVSSRKGLNTESKNRINILSQYSRKLCSTQLTDQWQSDNSGQPICNACEQYTKEYGFDPPVHLHGSVIKKRPINRTQK
jgi:phosphohistidine swiveling domain-containing protein